MNSSESRPIQTGYHNWKSLSQIYGLSEKTLRRRLSPVIKSIEKKAKLIPTKKKIEGKIKTVKVRPNYFNFIQLKMIVSNLGEPMNYTFNGKKFIPDSE